ncbi:glycosyltransferase 87 family protein [Terrabacter carboxydivorans]|uniref:DUF2029 domain-containing protein n=1 Tax=Terrabacter carboxydivorans TaxID=619730 RepID=A0ABN3LZP4_9MICO
MLILAWTAAAVVLLVQSLRVRSLWYYGTDIEATWDGARNLLRTGDPYVVVPGHSPFVYPPSAALLFAPAALVDNRLFVAGGQLLTVVAAVALGAALAALVGARWCGPVAACFVIVMTLSSVGTETLGYANLSWAVAALAGWTLVAMQHLRWHTAAVLIGLAVAIKPMAATLALVLLVERRYRALALAAAIPLLLNLATIPLLRAPAEFVTVVLPRVLSGATTGVGSNPSLWGFGVRHELDSPVVWFLRALLFAATAGLVVVAARRRSPAHHAVIGLGSAAAVMLVVQVNQPSYGLVVLPLAAALFAVGDAWTRAVLIAASGLILSCGTPGWVPTDATMLGELALLAASARVTMSGDRTADIQPAYVSRG